MKYIFILLLLLSTNALAKNEVKHHVDIEKRPMSDFTLKSNKGTNIRLSELRGQVVMLNFWASWCGPCIQEMPELQKIHEKYAITGLAILGINLDIEEKNAARFLKKSPVDFPILYDPNSEVRRFFKNDGIPYSVFINCDGVIEYEFRSYNPGHEEEYISIIQKLNRSCES